MAHPISDTYLDVQTLRANAALAAAGAWDAAPLEVACPGFDTVTIAATYDQGAAALGAVDIQVWVSAYALTAMVPAGFAEWIPASVYGLGGVVAAADTQSLTQAEYVTFSSVGVAGAAEGFVLGPITITGIERLRVRARESGVPGTPGALTLLGRFA